LWIWFGGSLKRSHRSDTSETRAQRRRIFAVHDRFAHRSSVVGAGRGRILAKKSDHPVRDILLGAAGGALGGLWMSGWNPIGGVVGGVVGGIVAGIKALC